MGCTGNGRFGWLARACQCRLPATEGSSGGGRAPAHARCRMAVLRNRSGRVTASSPGSVKRWCSAAMERGRRGKPPLFVEKMRRQRLSHHMGRYPLWHGSPARRAISPFLGFFLSARTTAVGRDSTGDCTNATALRRAFVNGSRPSSEMTPPTTQHFPRLPRPRPPAHPQSHHRHTSS